jgi:hypothetical protein
MRRKLKDIAEIQLGYQPRTTLRADPAGTRRVIQIRDVREDGLIDYCGLIRVSPERGPERYEVRVGDVLFISRGSRLQAAPVGTPPFPTLAVSFFYILRPDPAVVDAAYLAWAINQPDAQEQIWKHAMGTGIPHIRREPVESLLLEIPALDVQRRVLTVQQLLKREAELAARLQERRRELALAVCLNACHAEAAQRNPRRDSRPTRRRTSAQPTPVVRPGAAP